MNVNVRKASREDLSGIVDLLHEFAEFEKLTDYFKITEQKLAKVLFGSEAFVECLVAVDAECLVAIAIFYPNFATFRGQTGMYLEDIYIKSEYRGVGLGSKLLKEVAKTARFRGCERLDFVVLDWNTTAIKFYEKHGAIRVEEERRFKFIDNAFTNLCS